MSPIFQRLSRLLAVFSLSFSALLYVDAKPRLGPAASTVLRYLRLLAGGLSSLSLATGLVGATLGLLTRNPLAAAGGAFGAWLSARHLRRLAAPRGDFTRAFGRELPRPLPAPAPLSAVRWETDLVYYADPGNGRPLTCDLWRPPRSVMPGGLALIYLHGGGWRALDKDTFTRPFFRRLAARGHLVMDVAYRLYPEVDLVEMVADVKRAVAWLKAQSGRYGHQPDRLVLAGGSAGGQLALLAAYTPGHPDLTPPDLLDRDGSVRAVVAYYPPVDLQAYVEFKNINPVTFGPLHIPARWQVTQRLLGGSPDDVPQRYTLASPAQHVSAQSPPTLLLLAGDDDIVPAAPVRALHQRLVDARVPAILIEYPAAEHGFDLVLPQLSPLAQAAFADLERFLAYIR